MVTSSKRGGAVARPATGRAGDVAAGVMHLVKSTVVTALAGASDVGAEMGNAAVGAVRGSIRAAGVIGGDVARLAVDAAEGAIDAADRITAAAGRAATNLVDATLTGMADIGRRPAQRVAGRAESSVAPTADGKWPARPGTPAPRKPLARQPSRVARTVTRTRRRSGAA